MADHRGACAGFCSIKRLGAFLLLSGWDASPSQECPSIQVTSTQLHNLWWREALRRSGGDSFVVLKTTFAFCTVHTSSQQDLNYVLRFSYSNIRFLWLASSLSGRTVRNFEEKYLFSKPDSFFFIFFKNNTSPLGLFSVQLHDN